MRSIFFLATALLFVGCGADKTVEEYQNEETQKKKAQFDVVSGSYTGILTSNYDGQVLGALQMDLSVRIDPNSDNTGTPVVQTNFYFLDANETRFAAEKSFYDPATGTFSAVVRISRESGNAEEVTVNGNLDQGSFSGTIGASRYPRSGGSMRLQKNGRPVEELLREARPGGRENDGENREVSTYVGTTTFASGPRKAVRFVILQKIRNTPEDFLDLIYPVKVVQVGMNFGQSLNFLFTNATFDTSQGLLTGDLLFTAGQRMALACNFRDGQEMGCRHTTTGNGVIATTAAQLARGPVQDPPEDDEERRSVTKRFLGKGKLGSRMREMEFTVTRPVRSRLDDLLELFFPNAEKIVNASIIFEKETGTSATFTGSKWDSRTGSLDGTFQGGTGGGYTAYLRCENFYFTESRTEFSCDYWTSRSSVITITFKPPFR